MVEENAYNPLGRVFYSGSKTVPLVVWGLPLGRIKQLIMASSVQVHDRKVWNVVTGEVGLYITGLVVSKLFTVFRGVVLPWLTQHRC